ncbi:MAG: hypothetical protein MCSN_1610 [Candidatus Microsyncoccus archaeolyticus]|jgi:hypothetical protein|nr:MAG: hypothetical protein MCSN_1610 [Candidatus Parcubacteria bacterium]
MKKMNKKMKKKQKEINQNNSVFVSTSKDLVVFFRKETSETRNFTSALIRENRRLSSSALMGSIVARTDFDL